MTQHFDEDGLRELFESASAPPGISRWRRLAGPVPSRRGWRVRLGASTALAVGWALAAIGATAATALAIHTAGVLVPFLSHSVVNPPAGAAAPALSNPTARPTPNTGQPSPASTAVATLPSPPTATAQPTPPPRAASSPAPTVAPTAVPGPGVSGLRVTPTTFFNNGTNYTIITFVLGAPAVVSIDWINASGTVVRQQWINKSCPAGRQSPWAYGYDPHGYLLPPGRYTIRVTATANGGSSTASTGLTLTAS